MLYTSIGKYPSQQTIHFIKGLDIAINGRVIEDKELRKKCLIRNRYVANFIKLRQIVNNIMMIMKSKRTLRSMKKTFGNLDLDHDFSKSNEEIINDIFQFYSPYVEALVAHIKVTFSSMAMNTSILVSLLGAEAEFSDEHYGDFALLLSIDSGSDAVESADVPSALQEGVKFLTSDDCPVKEDYQDFMSKHGHRCVKEALVRAQNMTKHKKLTVDEALEQLQSKLTSKQKKSLRKEVLKAREYVGYREQAKSLLIRTVDQYRKQFRKFGRKLVSEGRLPDEELIFFMTWEEIVSLMKTRSAKIIQRAMKRKRLHPLMDKLKFHEINYGVPKPIEDALLVTDNADGKIVLKGTPVSRGIIEGTARVIPQVEDANNLEPGDILVTNATDIAWSPYFPSLSGVITEIGGLISHGAVVAREYGIACVVGVTNATIHLKSGDKIRLNGNDGTIQVLQ
ncbi:putative phosphoenolpyruvate synthase [Nymphon striatum]|nr:putative phosphoenolpyruvate synthase [Nymphon striatum]